MGNVRLKTSKQREEFECKLEQQKLSKVQAERAERIRKLRLQKESLEDKIAGQKAVVEFQKQFLDRLQTFVLHDCESLV